MITIMDLSEVIDETNENLAEIFCEFADKLRSLGVGNDEDDDQTYTVELDREEFDFLMSVVEGEIVDADTVETTAKFVHLRDKMLEAKGEEE